MNTPPAQLVQIPLGSVRLDESTDPKQSPATLLALKNCLFVQKTGRIEKRSGTAVSAIELTDGSTADGELKKLWVRDGELAMTDGEAVYSYARNSERWRRVDAIDELELTWKPAVETMRSVNYVDVAANDRGVLMAWVENLSSSDIFMQFVTHDGSRGIPPTFVIAGQRPRVFLVGDTAYVFYRLGAGGQIVGHSYSLTTFEFVAGATVVTGVSGDAQPTVWDIAWNGTDFTLFWKNASNEARVAHVSTSFILGSSVLIATHADIAYMSVDSTDDEYTHVAFIVRLAPDDVYIATLTTSSLASVVAAHTIATSIATAAHASIARVSATELVAVFARSGTDTRTDTTRYTVSGGSHVQQAAQVTRVAWPASRPFVLNGRLYALMASRRAAVNGFTRNTTFLVRIDDDDDGVTDLPHRLVGVIAPRESVTPASVSNVSVVDGTAYLPALYSSDLRASRSGLYLAKLSSEMTHPWHSASVGRVLAMSGAAASAYDGYARFEIGFLHPPRVRTSTTGSSGAMAAGTYLYTFIYEYRDATGLLYRSAPCDPETVTVGASGSVDFDIETATTTGKASIETGFDDNALTVHIVPYRTLVGGTTFRRCAIEPSNGIIVNDPLDDQVSWTDTAADVTLATQPFLYTTGGKLDEVMPPSFVTCVSHRGRVYGVAGDRRTIWASKVYTTDPGVFPGFHENLRIVLDEDITALASLDEKLVIFSESSIWIAVGDGPNSAGIGAFDVPSVIQSDVGAINARGVVETPDGVMFVSRRGIYLLTRSLEVSWIGREVRETLDEYPTVLDSILVPHRNQVRFSLLEPDFADDPADTGVTLVYDYVNRMWSVFNYYVPDPESASGPVKSMVVWDNTLCFTAGTEFASEDDETSLDAGTEWVNLAFEIALVPSGPVAWQHVRRLQILGERVTDHRLRVQLAFDNRPSFSQDFTFTAPMVVVNNDCPTVRIGSQNGANPKCKAIRVRVSDSSPTEEDGLDVTSGRGGWFSAIGLELIPKPNLARHGARYSKV